MTPIEHTKNINGTASVEAMSKIQKKYNSPGHYKIQFFTCSCKNSNLKKKKKSLKIRTKTNKQPKIRTIDKTRREIQSNGFCKETSLQGW